MGTAVVLALLMAVLLNVPQFAAKAPALYAALAFLALLQVTALVFNLIPCPGLDGWGIIEPFFPRAVRDMGRRLGMWGPIILVAALFLVPGLNRWFWQFVLETGALIGLDTRAAFLGYKLFQFWR
jgi:Zn-dependent protease